MLSRFSPRQWGPDVGLLFLRLSIGGLMLSMGWAKLANFRDWTPGFPDPLGVGSSVSLGVVILAQVPCTLLVMAGCFTRLSSIPPMVVLLVAAFIVHARSPWPAVEHALLYAIPFVVFSITGAGRISVDFLLLRSRPGSQSIRDSCDRGPVQG
jgi:putative oxidoreductase